MAEQIGQCRRPFLVELLLVQVPRNQPFLVAARIGQAIFEVGFRLIALTVGQHQAHDPFAASSRLSLAVNVDGANIVDRFLETLAKPKRQFVANRCAAGKFRVRPHSNLPNEWHWVVVFLQIIEALGEIVVLQRFIPVRESGLITAIECLGSNETQVSHRELGKARLNSAKVKKQYVASFIRAALHEIPARIDGREELIRRTMRFSKPDELGLLQRFADPGESPLQDSDYLITRQEAQQI